MILKNDIPKTCSYTRMILYSLQHFKALQLHIRTDYCNNHNVNVNTFCKCKHDTFLEEKKILQRNKKRQKMSCRAFRREKNILPTKVA